VLSRRRIRTRALPGAVRVLIGLAFVAGLTILALTARGGSDDATTVRVVSQAKVKAGAIANDAAISQVFASTRTESDSIPMDVLERVSKQVGLEFADSRSILNQDGTLAWAVQRTAPTPGFCIVAEAPNGAVNEACAPASGLAVSGGFLLRTAADQSRDLVIALLVDGASVKAEAPLQSIAETQPNVFSATVPTDSVASVQLIGPDGRIYQNATIQPDSAFPTAPDKAELSPTPIGVQGPSK
jgi:hypothetical protein